MDPLHVTDTLRARIPEWGPWIGVELALFAASNVADLFRAHFPKMKCVDELLHELNAASQRRELIDTRVRCPIYNGVAHCVEECGHDERHPQRKTPAVRLARLAGTAALFAHDAACIAVKGGDPTSVVVLCVEHAIAARPDIETALKAQLPAEAK